MNRDKLACNCHKVTYGQIVDLVKSGVTDFEEIRERTGAGKGCGKCTEFVESLVRSVIRFPGDYE